LKANFDERDKGSTAFPKPIRITNRRAIRRGLMPCIPFFFFLFILFTHGLNESGLFIDYGNVDICGMRMGIQSLPMFREYRRLIVGPEDYNNRFTLDSMGTEQIFYAVSVIYLLTQ
jgi:hypothetical protein